MKKYIFIINLVFLFGCAQFVPPTGGPKDLTPPKLALSIPENKTINFKGNTITLEFDEYVDITALRQELIITPDPKSLYNVKQKDKNIKLIFDKPFEDSTTYTFNFRNGIKDLNEKNPAKNLKIVLSTGPQIDSLSLKGNIIDLHTKKPILDALVGLYKSDTLPLSKKKPDYFIKTDTLGNFQFENIKNNKYFVMAFYDKNQNLIFDQKNENIGFLKDSIILNQNITLDTIQIYPANYTKNKIKKIISRETEFIIQLDKTAKKVELELKDPFLVTYYDKSNINIFKLDQLNSDTLTTTIITQDSLNIIDTLTQKIYFASPLKNKRKIQAFPILNTSIYKQEQTKNINYNLNFQYPITTFDSTKIIFKSDTVISEQPSFNWINKNRLNITITTKAKNIVELLIPSNTFTNYRGDTNTLYNLKTKILGKEELGTLEGYTINKEGTKIAQLINEDSGLITDEQIFKDKFFFADIIPGTYNVKIIIDENENGIWDPGNITTLVMPEKILINKTSIRVRGNFDLKDIKIE
ncbi:hypothetical protein EGI22_00480 [Lacihabitans sp. LS3-19]|uniref:Ig-like domain-containing protein n=1 Tax=Lacihabitans sp. LS3-19 TaxID=2487335 RepID=UPI0020CBA89D|nr:Ig-like domain-containing protein [Lacihabitans sp. LS3-19]MCP9766362.1 hypothetical protein [Lacihabitans sp. LS3-19]